MKVRFGTVTRIAAQATNNAQSEMDIPSFTELTRMVGQTKEPYSDQ